MRSLLMFLCLTVIIISCKNSEEKNKKENLTEPFIGKWMMQKDSFAIMEDWQQSDTNYVVGKSFVVKQSDTALQEVVQLMMRDNKFVYSVVTMNQNNAMPVDFTATSTNNNTWIFENMQHDFPKRITYQFIGKDSLHAWIDNGTDSVKQDYYYHRLK